MKRAGRPAYIVDIAHTCGEVAPKHVAQPMDGPRMWRVKCNVNSAEILYTRGLTDATIKYQVLQSHAKTRSGLVEPLGGADNAVALELATDANVDADATGTAADRPPAGGPAEDAGGPVTL